MENESVRDIECLQAANEFIEFASLWYQKWGLILQIMEDPDPIVDASKAAKRCQFTGSTGNEAAGWSLAVMWVLMGTVGQTGLSAGDDFRNLHEELENLLPDVVRDEWERITSHDDWDEMMDEIAKTIRKSRQLKKQIRDMLVSRRAVRRKRLK